MDIFKWLFLLLFGITFFGCNTPSHEQLENVFTFDLSSVPELQLVQDQMMAIGSYRTINALGDVAVDDEDHIYVVGEFNKKINVFDERGRHLSSFGGIGSDLGEFQKPRDLIVANERLYVFDENMHRISQFSLDDFAVEATNLNATIGFLGDSLERARPVEFIPWQNETFLVGFQLVNTPEDQQMHYFKVDQFGALVSDQIISFKSKGLYVDNTMTTQVIMMLPYERETLLATDSEKHIYTIHTEDFLVKVHDAEGNYQRAYHYPFTKKNLVGTDVVEMYRNVHQRRAIRGADLPATWPAIADFFVDDEDRLWIAAITQNLENYTWFVMEKSGEVIGKFELGKEKEIVGVRNGFMYIKEFKRNQHSHRIFKYMIDS